MYYEASIYKNAINWNGIKLSVYILDIHAIVKIFYDVN